MREMIHENDERDEKDEKVERDERDQKDEKDERDYQFYSPCTEWFMTRSTSRDDTDFTRAYLSKYFSILLALF